MKRLLLSASAKDSATSSSPNNSISIDDFTSNSLKLGFSNGVNSDNVGVSGVSDDAINLVDQFLREALQNPRERLSILRMEQDVEQFIQDPTRQQLEFQQLPTSYLRLAAHRVAQHYFLQSMVLLDNSLPDGSGSRIIVQKTSTECRLPRIRLADIPVNLPQEDNGAVKVAIKQRPQKNSHMSGGGNSGSQKAQHAKSVEERKEEYNKARARIFNSSNHSGSTGVKPDIEPKKTESLQLASLGLPRVDEKSASGGSDFSGRAVSVVDCSSGSSRSERSRTEKDPVSRQRSSNRVAIFRDREFDRKDPDYDRNYDRYLQRYDPGFGYNTGPYTVQPMYSPALNYNTEFPQLGAAPRPQISVDPSRPLPQHIPGPWATPSNPTGLSFGHPETMMAAYNPNHVNPRSASAIYLHTAQYPCQRPGMPFIHPHEHIHQSYQQSQQQQHDAALGFARPVEGRWAMPAPCLFGLRKPKEIWRHILCGRVYRH
ncbi:R3H domain-containing protein 2 [Bienertia sinuspersici]